MAEHFKLNEKNPNINNMILNFSKFKYFKILKE